MAEIHAVMEEARLRKERQLEDQELD
jgi:hypothetical protein